jgi:hypothetical protein
LNESQSNDHKYILNCPRCGTECLASYRETKGPPTIKFEPDEVSSSRRTRTECCCCWADKEKTVHYSFMVKVPYEGDKDIEFINSVLRGKCNDTKITGK